MGLILCLLRHGRTEWTDAGRFCGHADVGLTGEGRRELARVRLPAADYASVVSSDLRRCRETADALGFEPVLDPALREFDFGRMEGARWDDLPEPTRRALHDRATFAAPGGERGEDFALRVDGFVDGLADGVHLLITHGGVIHHLLARAGRAEHVEPGGWVELELSRR